MVQNKDLRWLSQICLRFLFSSKEHTHTCIYVKVYDVKLTHTPTLLTSASHPLFKQPHIDLWDWEALWRQTQEISYTHRSPLHLPAPISPHFCLLSFLSYELSFSLPFLLSPLISYCASLWNVHRPRISMKCHCSVCWKALHSFFFSFGYEEGKKRPSWQSDKESFSERDTKRWGKKGRKSWDNIWQWFTYSSHHQGEIWT